MIDSINPTTNTHINSTPVKYSLDVTNQMTAHKQEENSHVAPKILPIAMENAALEITSKAFLSVLELRKLINTTESITRLNTAAVQSLNNLIDDISETLLIKIPQELDKLSI